MDSSRKALEIMKRASGFLHGDRIAGGGAKHGYAALVLDSLYVQCAKDLEEAAAGDEIYFSLDSNFILQSCQYVPRGCADDCTRDVRIDSLASGP